MALDLHHIQVITVRYVSQCFVKPIPFLKFYSDSWHRQKSKTEIKPQSHIFIVAGSNRCAKLVTSPVWVGITVNNTSIEP